MATSLLLSIFLFALTADREPASAAPDPAAIATVRAYERARIDLIREITPTVVCMFSKDDQSGGGGSGVIIDPEGYGLTNFHVVAGMMQQREGKGGLFDHKLYDFEVLGIDPGGDVAMFKLNRREPFVAAPLGDSDTLVVGDYAIAAGNPFLLAEDYTPTITLGIISGLHRYQWGSGRALRYTDCIQVDTSINPGNSGGPLFDMSGRVIGINGRVSIEERGRVNVGVGYAISINQIKRFIPALRASLPTKHATAGFTVIDRSHGAMVNQILDDSPAYKAGLRLGDRIETFGGKSISSANHFTSQLGTYPGGWPVTVTLRREDEKKTIRFRLENLPFPDVPKGPPGTPPQPDPYRQTKKTRTANRRAVTRTLNAYEAACGGAGAFKALRSITMTGQRTLTSRTNEPQEVRFTENRPEVGAVAAGDDPAAFEQAIRWELMTAVLDPAAARLRIVRSDEVQDRVCGVVERSGEGVSNYEAFFDDENGRLLRIEFDDARTGKRARYDYADFKRSGTLKLPHRRTIFLDEVQFAEDVFDGVTASSQVAASQPVIEALEGHD